MTDVRFGDMLFFRTHLRKGDLYGCTLVKIEMLKLGEVRDQEDNIRRAVCDLDLVDPNGASDIVVGAAKGT